MIIQLISTALTAIALLSIPGAQAVVVGSTPVYISLLVGGPCARENFSIGIASGPYKRAVVVQSREKSTYDEQDFSLLIAPGRYYLEAKSATCGWRWPATILPKRSRHFVVRPVATKDPGKFFLRESDNALTGSLPAPGISYVALRNGASPDADLLYIGAVDDEQYYFENVLYRGKLFLEVGIADNSAFVPVTFDPRTSGKIFVRNISVQDIAMYARYQHAR